MHRRPSRMKRYLQRPKRVGVVWGLLALFVSSGAYAAPDKQPNIIVIVADDLGWADVSYHGSPIPTPNIDRLVRGGVELDQHYVAPMCTPTRAALLSGRYWSRFGNTSPSNTQVFPTGTLTLAGALRSRGYETGISGKWHLGSLPKWGPKKFGFDRSHGSLAGGVGPWNHAYKRGEYTRTWHRNDVLLTEEGHVTDLIAAESVGFITSPRKGPFFLYVPFTAVHHPLDEPPEWLRRGRQADPKRPQYAASAMHMDDAVGQIVKSLETAGQRDNTLIVFFSDNGGTINPADGDNARYPGGYPENEPLGLNEPLRGRKTQVYEGGIRTPAFVNWAGRLKPGKVHSPLHVVDWMPTLCKLAGHESASDLKWDGRDIWPIVSGETTTPKSRVLYWQGVGRRSAALRQGNWKLIVHRKKAGDELELFDLEEDPGEKQDLSAAQSQRVAKLKQLLADETTRDNDAVPQP
ncbi:MAG: arylsulfatase [Planctomycetaceae bacterium]|nr:arylsulfatase [Planctomycetaceae bacterium]